MMKTYVKLGAFLALWLSGAGAAELPCEQHYLAGLDRMSEGDHMGASAEFTEAIRLMPEPYVGDFEYLPYIQLAVASFKAGRNRAARDSLIQSQVYGTAATSDTGRLLIDEYASQIMSATLGDDPPLPQLAVADSTVFAQDSRVLTELEVMGIREKVLRRCAVSPGLDDNKLPWYFHYEFGNDLLEAGDSKRALDSYLLSANMLEIPKRGKRMYGMWFIDYTPYYRIALTHARLGDWESARAAIVTSETLGEFSSSDSDYERFRSLQNAIAAQVSGN